MRREEYKDPSGFNIVLIFPDKSENDIKIIEEVKQIMVEEAIVQINIKK